MDGLWNLALNVAASAVYALLVFLAVTFLTPLARGHLQRAPKLHGTRWVRRAEDGGVDKIQTVLRVKQWGSRILAVAERSEPTGERRYRYVGDVRGGTLVLSWEDDNAPEFMRGAMVLHLSRNLQQLAGASVYYSEKRAKVVTTYRVYDRR